MPNSLSPSTMNDSKDFIKPLCVVCDDQSEGQHFGQYSCKACAAFFRRAVASKMQFECKFDKYCEISKDIRNICRYCRYQKCLNKGMLPSAVQAHRDSYGKRSHLSGSPTSITSNDNNNYYGEMKRLPLMLDGYLKFQSLRKASYALLVGGGNFKSWDPKFIPQSTYSNAKKSSQMVTSLIYDMVNEFFVPFTNFPPDDKKILFEQFSVLFDNAEKSYNTFKAYGHIENNDKVILADGGYVKLDEIYKYYINSLDVNADPQQLVRIFLQCFTYIAKVVVPTMIKAGIDDYSMIAIYGLCLFQDYNADITAETREIVSEVKEEILRDLHIYYRNQGLSDIELTTKMSKIMLLVPTLEHVGRLFRENFHLVDLFCMLDVPRAYK